MRLGSKFVCCITECGLHRSSYCSYLRKPFLSSDKTKKSQIEIKKTSSLLLEHKRKRCPTASGVSPCKLYLVASTLLHVNHDATPLPHSIYSQPMRSQSPPNSWREPASCTHYRTHTQTNMHTHAELHIHGLIGVKVTSLSCILPFKMLTLKVAAGYNFKQIWGFVNIVQCIVDHL